ncbi:MAG: tRNA preQ1(34) S-adenosylmethionine ribosyltransferase-isomerase QueA [Gammaproteobacteria bacterium]|nr:tRNA preQ1(34) S-adenosylmethionine ribosyltransferase-isomerase QueA [Gammaproteobacteria bacterium]NIP89303.1 tRNA preQ1(34) S-adenosylmethionine ribosyltransferase-isomerase QueA [Gammaproteobacteria bacterium]NIR24137.1 tRNA preQ1(34) S-adenosylmethionine ribosyltransferase-isomerase QueA [Gammaproteobacteria bacterium]NIS05806.1 tRNA preQ1(34) S-adenosylmethionine ribosyltransferase-isomerase QueA [Gammaproteobacteria bacterium]NIU41045.1 tRNA preQ1(34) S-adenosylmethionine ribosyltrans
MRASDFRFELPPELIAQYPLEHRRESRLLVMNGCDGGLEDRRFDELGSLLEPGDLLVMNDTRVIKARLAARKPTGGRVEILVERIVDARRALAHVRASRSPALGSQLIIDDGVRVRVCGRRDDLFELEIEGAHTIDALIAESGRVPLPPYIRREPERLDEERYQTVYAREDGAVAAPTAGLHFDADMLEALRDAGVGIAFITLRVGAGTFQPLRSDDVDAHVMHAEHARVSEAVCEQVAETRRRGGRVVAVGTTSVRALESASAGGVLAPFEGETRLFIKPGHVFRSVDALLTNFHLPESTLLMLVCAFAGFDNVMRAYRHAVAARYRFFSYGDAMFVTAASP